MDASEKNFEKHLTEIFNESLRQKEYVCLRHGPRIFTLSGNFTAFRFDPFCPLCGMNPLEMGPPRPSRRLTGIKSSRN